MKIHRSSTSYALLLCFSTVVFSSCSAPQQFSSNSPNQSQTSLPPSSQTQIEMSTFEVLPPTQQQDQGVKVTILSPDLSKPLKSPLVLHGKVSGTFFFEGTFPVTLVDAFSGKTIAHASAQADGEWATDAQVSFTVKVPFKVKSQTEAKLIFNSDNPSGLPQNDFTDTFNVTLEK